MTDSEQPGPQVPAPSQRGWAALGKVATVLGLMWTLILMYGYFFPRTASVHASCSVNEYSESPTVQTERESLRRQISPDAISKALKDSGLGDDLPTQTNQTAFSQRLSLALATPAPSGAANPPSSTGRYVKCSVLNSGAMLADKVVLDLANPGTARVTLEDRTTRIDSARSAVEVGTIRPGNQVSVELWTSGFFILPWVPEIRLSHTGGTGSVSFDERVTGVWASLARNAPPALFAVVFVGVFIWLAWGVAQFQQDRAKRRTRDA